MEASNPCLRLSGLYISDRILPTGRGPSRPPPAGVYWYMITYASKLATLIASSSILSKVTARFAENFCTHPLGTRNSIVGKGADGSAYHTRA
eukprot:4999408-Pleurochrysis_carterae.AAC.2